VKPLSDKNKSENAIIVTTKEIAEILGLSDRRIRQLENEGSLVKISRGRFDLPASIQRYIETIREQNQSAEELDLNKEKTLLTRANRQKVEIELKIMQGDLHRSEDVESVMNNMIASSRAQLLTLPRKVAPLVLGQKDVDAIQNIIKKYVYEALQELSEYNPHVFYAKSKDKLSVSIEEGKHSEESENKAEKGPRLNGKRKTAKN